MRAIVLLGLLTGCATDVTFTPTPDDVLVEPPALGVAPTFVQYGELRRAEAVERVVTITNVGGAVLDVESIALDAPGAPEDFVLVELPELPLALPSGQSAPVTVRFAPRAGGLREAALVVGSDAPEGASARVPLSGFGAVPRLDVSPAAIELGERPLGCGSVSGIRLTSSGREPVALTGVELVGGGAILGGVPSLPATLEPGTVVPLTVAHVPQVLGPWSAVVRVTSDGTAAPVEVPITAVGLPRPIVEEVFVVPDTAPVDVLVVVDQSCSMADQVDTLVAEFDRFTSRLEDLAFDWRVAVYTGSDPECFSDVVDPSMPDWAERFAVATRTQVVPPSGWAQTSEGYDLTEAPLEGLVRASDRDVSGGCNEGFRRADAPLHVVDISDEREQSTGWSASTRYWEYFLGELRAWVGRDDLLVWHAIVDTQRACGLEPFGPDGHADVAAETGGQVLDVCGAWADQLEGIADAVAPGRQRFVLAWSDLVPTTLDVTIDGVPVAVPPSYDLATRELVLGEPAPRGSTVVVRYERLTDCPT